MIKGLFTSQSLGSVCTNDNSVLNWWVLIEYVPRLSKLSIQCNN